MQKLKTSVNGRGLVIMIAAFAAVYVIWGSTYLGIKFAIETLPSFLMAGVRFTVAGGILLLIARLSPNYKKPKRQHWRTSLIVGFLLLTIGNGGVVVAEHYISSSLAALLVATLPFWMVLLGWMFADTGRPTARVTLGLLVGFAGVGLLISGSGTGEAADSSGQIFGIVCIMLSTIGWTFGSLYGAKAPTVDSPILGAGMQMLSGGVILLVVSTLLGEWRTFEIAAVSTNSWLALAYLIVFGAIIAYTAYSWLLKNASAAAISTYAYVNPAIAVLLGWALAGETLSGQMLIGAVIIVGSVALLTLQKKTVVTPADITTPTGAHAELSTSS